MHQSKECRFSGSMDDLSQQMSRLSTTRTPRASLPTAPYRIFNMPGVQDDFCK